jgi:hypothetical protein
MDTLRHLHCCLFCSCLRAFDRDFAVSCRAG